jgi:hypothetical protein
MAIRQVASSGDGSVLNPSAMVFLGSGGAAVAVSAIGGGSALVTIGAASGASGASGSPGSPGLNAGFNYNFLSDTTSGDPGAGNMKFNTGPTRLRISKTDADGVSLSGFFATVDGPTSSIRGHILLRSKTTPSTFKLLEVTGPTVDSGTFDAFVITLRATSGPFVDGDPMTVNFYRTGDAGASGVPGAQGPQGPAGTGGGSLRVKDGQTTVQPTTELYFDGPDVDDIGGGSASVRVGASALVANRASASIRSMLGYDAERAASGRAVSFESTMTPGVFLTALTQRSDDTVGTGSGMTFAASGFDAENQRVERVGSAVAALTASAASPAATTGSALEPMDALSAVELGRLITGSVFDARLMTLFGGEIVLVPVAGGTISLYDPLRGWRLYSLRGSVRRNLSGLTANTNYDVYVFDTGDGNLMLEFVPWTNSVNRSVALALQDGIHVKSGAPERRYVGAFRATTPTTTIDATNQMFVWSMYHRWEKRLKSTQPTGSWTYNSTIWRVAAGTVATTGNNKSIEVLNGVPDQATQEPNISLREATILDATLTVPATAPAGVTAAAALSLTSSPTGGDDGQIAQLTAAEGMLVSRMVRQMAQGYYMASWWEMVSGGTATFYADRTLTNLIARSHIIGSIRA